MPADRNAWIRANWFPFSYGPDGPAPSKPESKHDDAESAREDLRIPPAIVRGADLMEIYSPPMVAEVCRNYMLEPGESLDLKSC